MKTYGANGTRFMNREIAVTPRVQFLWVPDRSQTLRDFAITLSTN